MSGQSPPTCHEKHAWHSDMEGCTGLEEFYQIIELPVDVSANLRSRACRDLKPACACARAREAARSPAVTGASTRCTLHSSTRISRAFEHSACDKREDRFIIARTKKTQRSQSSTLDRRRICSSRSKASKSDRYCQAALTSASLMYSHLERIEQCKLASHECMHRLCHVLATLTA